MGIEPTPSAWKAEVLPLNYTRAISLYKPAACPLHRLKLVEGGGFEPPKAEPSDLQSDPFGHSGTPPDTQGAVLWANKAPMSTIVQATIVQAIVQAGK